MPTRRTETDCWGKTNPFSNTAKSCPAPLRIPEAKRTVRNPGESPLAICEAVRSPRLLKSVSEICVLPSGAKKVRLGSIALAHSTNRGLFPGIAGSIEWVVSVGLEKSPPRTTCYS